MENLKLTQIEIGYLTGFIDGEGSLIINKREHIGYKGKRYTTYSAYIDIGNTNIECLEYIHKLLGISSKLYSSQSKGNRKLAHRMRISYKQAYPLVKLLEPYLIVKRDIAKLFLEYKNSTDKEILFQKAKILNKRGIF